MKRDYGNTERDFLLSFTQFEGKRVLEIGCGNGYYTEMIAPFAREVVALEPDKKDIAIAIEKLSNYGDKVKFLLGKTEGLIHGLKRDFDIILFSYSLHHHDCPLRVIKDTANKLQAGGWIIIVEPRADGQFCQLLSSFHDESEVLEVADTDIQNVFTTTKFSVGIKVDWLFNDKAELREFLDVKSKGVLSESDIELLVADFPENEIIIKDKVIFWRLQRR